MSTEALRDALPAFAFDQRSDLGALAAETLLSEFAPVAQSHLNAEFAAMTAQRALRSCSNLDLPRRTSRLEARAPARRAESQKQPFALTHRRADGWCRPHL